jgi:hypothetical protein
MNSIDALEKYNTYARHLGHNIELANYADGSELTIECMECNEVIAWVIKEEVASE